MRPAFTLSDRVRRPLDSAKENMLTSHSETSRGRVSRSFEYLIRLTAVASLVVAVATACGGNVFSLEVGDCFNDPDTGLEEVSDVEVVECTEIHDNEVYALSDYPAEDDASYPGLSVLDSYGDDFCFDEFEGYVGAPYTDSRLDFSYFYPLPDGWENADDREITCFLYDLDLKKLTKSMKSSGE